MAKLTGTNPEQVPTNADLGTMAYQDKDNVNVGGGTIDGTVIGGSTPAAITGTTVTASSGLLELNGNDIGGTQVTIADDAVASITPPRTGGFMFVSCQGHANFPQHTHSGSLWYDVGGSLLAQKQVMDGGVGDDFAALNTDVTGTTGTDGDVTVATQSGVIKIENRQGSTLTFQITFL